MVGFEHFNGKNEKDNSSVNITNLSLMILRRNLSEKDQIYN
jgi:hypothetical protein